MRIRQHARISALSIAESSMVSPPPLPLPPQPFASKTPRTNGQCGLNRSSSDASAFRDHYQVKMNQDVKGNSFRRESACASESKQCEDEVKKVVEEEEEEEAAKRLLSSSEVDKEEKKNKKRAKKKYLYCIKSDGKGWQCKKEAKEGHSLCEYHFNKLRSYQCKRNRSSRKPCRRNTKGRESSSSSASVSDFYYYDGFTPSAGRRRAVGGKESNKKEDDRDAEAAAAAAAAAVNSSTHAVHVHDDDDNDVHVHSNIYDDIMDNDDDDDDEYVKDVGCKKRIRKPIKERSLKSLL